jgi:hypothetical protein
MLGSPMCKLGQCCAITPQTKRSQPQNRRLTDSDDCEETIALM